MLLNNCCESFNSVLREARTKPILQLMEWIRRYVMGRFFSKKEGLKSFSGLIMPSVVKMVERGLQEATNMKISEADLHEFEVDHEDDTYVVNLEQQQCTCFRWQLMGIPCWHALACMQKRRLNYEEFIHPAYHVQTYSKAYAPSFRAMPGQQQWDVTPHPKPLPPPHRKLPGRPSKHKRRKEIGEDEERNVKRAKKQNHCSRCGGLGHNIVKCKNPPLDKSVVPKKKVGRPKSTTNACSRNVQGTSTSATASETARATAPNAAVSRNSGGRTDFHGPSSSGAKKGKGKK
ncbi:uncharacterized protein LOC104897314 [Beta vulgaris subsp. vulgaris]|uniref:uncharacterized protein LOC104897314 n=1 Tax=Beta vulgaris subsp. vulgaris TaxID=3555 RepID=UPI002036A81E|nr:uncharacterized protein LOC104897314 [Beta vulgaris subsp. vulgaris]